MGPAPYKPRPALTDTTTLHDLLLTARKHYTQKDIATVLGQPVETVRQWEKNEFPCPTVIEKPLQELLANTPASATKRTGRKQEKNTFTFIDLFAGIGGIRKGFEVHGGNCVFTSEWNAFSEITYKENFPGNHPFIGDITQHPASHVPDHDVLLGGFPCQPFSIAGVSKKNALGRPHGFACTTQGTLFFDIARIIKEKEPVAFMLENVKNLKSHDRGTTFRVIMETLEQELGYEIHARVIDGQHFTPQHRERIIIIGFREPTGFTWDDLRLPEEGPKLERILHRTDGPELDIPWDEGRYFDYSQKEVNTKYTLTPKLWNYLQAYAAKHRAAGNGFGFGLVTPTDVSRTLSARYYKDGSEILVDQGPESRPRRLTPRECARLMGFPDSFRIPVSDTQAYRQFGNSVVMPVMQEMARIMVPHILQIKENRLTEYRPQQKEDPTSDG